MNKNKKVTLPRGGPIRLKPSRFHKSKKTYNRKREKMGVKTLAKNPTL